MDTAVKGRRSYWPAPGNPGGLSEGIWPGVAYILKCSVCKTTRNPSFATYKVHRGTPALSLLEACRKKSTTCRSALHLFLICTHIPMPLFPNTEFSSYDSQFFGNNGSNGHAALEWSRELHLNRLIS